MRHFRVRVLILSFQRIKLYKFTKFHVGITKFTILSLRRLTNIHFAELSNHFNEPSVLYSIEEKVFHFQFVCFYFTSYHNYFKGISLSLAIVLLAEANNSYLMNS